MKKFFNLKKVTEGALTLYTLSLFKGKFEINFLRKKGE